MRTEEKRMIRSVVVPAILVFLMWVVAVIREIGDFSLSFLGIYPQKWYGLAGIITTPFIHGDFSHLIANSVPMMVLGSALFYFYRDIAFRILVMIWLFTGFWVWVGAREAWHIGASGIVYGLTAFIFTSGIIRRHSGLLAMSLIVVFLYGSLIWGIFPEFFPEERISWESHLFGLVAGAALAVYYRRLGPQRKKYSWEEEEEQEDDEDPDGQNGYWNTTISDDEIRDIRHVYRRGTPNDQS
jgi:membrane associated rhomboid family serine protease